MKRFGYFVLLMIAVMLVGGPVAAQAGPTAFLKANDKKLNTLLSDTEKNKDKIIKIVNKMLDFDKLCRDSLGKHWDTRTVEQQQEFTKTLKALIEKNLINRLKDTKDRSIAYQSETVTCDTASVTTLISSGDDPRGEKTEIEYKLTKKEAEWGVVDMLTDGVSLVSNYRSQFNKIINEEGWDALIKKMKDKLAE
jgi:phospholipid transport system substrate-binding protein